MLELNREGTMNNPFSIRHSDLLSLFNDYRSKCILNIIKKFKNLLSEEEILTQIFSKTGPIWEATEFFYKEFGEKTENVEVLSVLTLVHFYFNQNANPILMFEMRNDFRRKSVYTYDELIQNINSYTHIDAKATLNDQKYNFQIKTYPQRYLEHSNGAFVGYLLKVISPETGYADMRGTILVILIQPKEAYSQTSFDFVKLTEDLHPHSSKISFDEIVLGYTDGGANTTTLHRIFPDNKRMDIDLDNMLASMRGESRHDA
jgi:hypothetical protein